MFPHKILQISQILSTKISFVNFFKYLISFCADTLKKSKPKTGKRLSKFADSCSFLRISKPSWDLIRADICRGLAEMVFVHEQTKQFWLKAFPCDANATAKLLTEKIFEHCNENFSRDSRNFKSIVAVLCDTKGLPYAPKILISMRDLQNTLEYFEPISPGFIEVVTELLRKKWFHGLLHKSELDAKMKNEVHGTFLVRFSSSRIGCYALSKASREQGTAPNHFLINHTFGSGFTFGSRSYERLEEIIFAKKVDFHLFYPYPGSPFPELFSEKLKSSRYCEVEEEDFN